MNLDELEQVYLRCLPEFRRVAAAIVGDRDGGCDAVQDAFALAVRKRRSFRGESALEAWVWRIVLNTARNYRRADATRHRAEARLDRTRESAGSAPHIPLEQLTERQREVVFLRHFADLSYDEIGAALGIASGTVGATLNNAHETLRRAMPEVIV